MFQIAERGGDFQADELKAASNAFVFAALL